MEVIDLVSDSSSSCVVAALKSGDDNTVISISSSSSIEHDEVPSNRDAPLSSSSSIKSQRNEPPSSSSNNIENDHVSPERSGRTKRSRSPSPPRAMTLDEPSKTYCNIKEAYRVYHRRKRAPEMVNAMHKALTTMPSNNLTNDAEFIGEWWDVDNTSRFSAGGQKKDESPLISPPMVSFVPGSVMVSSDHESVSSCVTIEPALSDSEVEIMSLSSSIECRTCERHSLKVGQIERLLENVKAIPMDTIGKQMKGCNALRSTSSKTEDDQFTTDFIAQIKTLLDEFEEDASSGISIFFHECSVSGQLNPILTTTKLLQVFDGLCHICTIAAKSDTRCKQLMLQLFSKKSGDCGVILRILHLATYELLVSREKAQHDLDHVLAVSFGLQMITTMMRNIYSDCRLELQDTEFCSLFLDKPLECHKFCIKRNCKVDNRGVTRCQCCGLRFHKSCFSNSVKVFDKCCPACNSAVSLFEACTDGNLAKIYSLVVEKGASPLQAVTGSVSSTETALHAAMCRNNYNLMSMLLFGAHLLLTCDFSLREWNFPSLAWGRDSDNFTPFEKGIDICLKDMNAKPPTEILLLLRNRGVDRGLEDIRDALERRHKMIQVMKNMSESDLLRSDLSMGLEHVPLRLSEAVSLGDKFFYVKRSVESRDIAIRWFDCRSGKKKSLSSFEGNCTKEKLMELHRDQGLPSSWQSYCNYLCSSKACSCQIEGLRFGLEIFETNGRGLGLRTAKGVSIKKGDVICNYDGEIISASEAKRRDDLYSAAGMMGSYTINLDESGEICIDATAMRSASAFINHSCAENNTYLSRALRHHLDQRFPFLVFRARKDIGELEELTFNYVKGMPDGQKPTGLCSSCSREHCLCHQCTELEHRKHSVMSNVLNSQ